MDMRLIFAGLAMLPAIGNTAGFDYTYVEVGYVNSDIDTGIIDVDGDGLGLRGAFAVNDRFHAFAGYSSQDLDLGLDSSVLDLGVGRSWSLQEDLDFIGELAWVRAELDTPFGNADEDGFGIGAKLRARTGERVELEGGIDYVDLDDSNTSFSFAGRYFLTRAFAIGAGIAIDDDDTAWNIGFRAQFGAR